MTGLIGYARCPDCDASAHHTHYHSCQHAGLDPRDIPSPLNYYTRARRAAAEAHAANHPHGETPKHSQRHVLDVTNPTDRAELISLFGAVRTWQSYLAHIDARIAHTATYNRWALDPRHALQKERINVLTELRLAEQNEAKEQDNV